MKRCVLNSDVLNDENNIYVQIDDIAILKYEVEMTDNPTKLFEQLRKCMDELIDQSIIPKALLIPFTLYNNLCIITNKIIDPTIGYKELFELMNGYSLPNIITYVPDRFKNSIQV